MDLKDIRSKYGEDFKNSTLAYNELMEYFQKERLPLWDLENYFYEDCRLRIFPYIGFQARENIGKDSPKTLNEVYEYSKVRQAISILEKQGYNLEGINAVSDKWDSKYDGYRVRVYSKNYQINEVERESDNSVFKVGSSVKHVLSTEKFELINIYSDKGNIFGILEGGNNSITVNMNNVEISAKE